MVYVGTRKWRYGYMLMSHMAATTLEELHQMADKLGIDRKHFQDKPGQPHYDICQTRKALAIDYGAVLVKDSEIINLWKTQ